MTRRKLQKWQNRPRSTSIPTGQLYGETVELGEPLRGRAKVKWAEPPVSKSLETTPLGSRRSVVVEDTMDRPPDPFTLYMTGKRLSDWRTMMPQQPSADDQHNADDQHSATAKLIPAAPPLLHTPARHESSCAVWEESASTPRKMNLSLDPNSLQRMLSPLGSGGESQSPPASSIVLSPAPSGSGSARQLPRHPSSSPSSSSNELSQRPSSSTHRLRIPQHPNVILRQAHTEHPVRSSRRSSLHLLNDRTPGSARSSHRATPVLDRDHDPDSASLSSSLSSPQSSQHQGSSTSAKRLRKAGFLLVRKWLVPQEDGSVALAEGEGWRHYWAILKGLQLYLYAVKDSNATARLGLESDPSTAPPIVLELLNCLLTPVPEYPKRQHVLCLSLGSGSALLAQAPSSVELEEWLGVVHSAAGLALARTTSGEVGLRTLRKELEKVEAKVGTVGKMIRLSELPSVGTVSVHALGDWERELELLSLQAYMARSYLAALRKSLPPSSQKVLAAASLETKNFLSTLGAFTISSMHALVLARTQAASASSTRTPTSSLPSIPNLPSPTPSKASNPSRLPCQHPSSH